MPRLPDDNPLVYPENTGDYMPTEFIVTQDTCSFCPDSEEGVVKDVLWRFTVGKWGCPESTNTICFPCARKEHDLNKLGKELEF